MKKKCSFDKSQYKPLGSNQMEKNTKFLKVFLHIKIRKVLNFWDAFIFTLLYFGTPK